MVLDARSLSLALALSSAGGALGAAGCGGTVVFEEDGGDGGSSSTNGSPSSSTTSSATNGQGGGSATSSGTGGVSATTVGPGSSVSVSSGGGGTGICGSGVSLFDGSRDACVGDSCCDLFQQCSLDGSDPAGCDVCIDQGGGPRCADALRCVRESGCFQGLELCAAGLTFGDPAIDECLLGNCCLEGLLCTQGGVDPNGCVDCVDAGGGPRCNDLLLCADQQGCFVATGICDSGLTTQDPRVDQCLGRNCCPEFVDCTAAGQQECLDCFAEGAGPLCDAALACAEENCAFENP